MVIIRDYKEYHTDATVRFVIKMTKEKLREAEMEGLHKVFKLQTAINTTSMVSWISVKIHFHYILEEIHFILIFFCWI
ncbi:unnamed protein product [Anisakis simplex]|uniref:DNA topoisomerase (ATP-hydrolyzing) n=1 Tax=Anisakis simplex TaxID=6269 RepID=A0A0M3JKZ9_ANISI|nr:unnamed protein product [Anisakis simplex]